MENMHKRKSVNLLPEMDNQSSTDDEELFIVDLEHDYGSQPLLPNKLAVIHSASDQHLFDEYEGDKHEIRRRKNSKSVVMTKHKPESPSSNASSHFTSKSMKIDLNKDQMDGICRSVPQSPAVGVNKVKKKTVFPFNAKKRDETKRKEALQLIQSETKSTNATNTPQPKKEIKLTITPRNSPNDSSCAQYPSSDYNIVNIKDIHDNNTNIIQSEESIVPYQFEPLHLDLSDDEVGADRIEIVDDADMILNGDKVRQYLISNGSNAQLVDHGSADSQSLFEETVANVNNFNFSFVETLDKTGEDSVSMSMSRPNSTKISKTVHFQHLDSLNTIPVSFMDDIEENKESADDMDEDVIAKIHAKQRKKKKSKKKRQSILNGKHRRGNLSLGLGKKRLSVENLIVHNGMNQLKSKLMDANLEKKHVAKMNDAELEQMLSYINRMQFLVLEEKQRRIQS